MRLTREQILKISNSPLSFNNLALEYGCNEKTIRRNLKKFNLRKIPTSRVGNYKWIKRFGKKSPNWGGGESNINGRIYLYFPKHPNATKKGYILKSRLVMENHLGRFLNHKEVVHHIDGNKLNNKIENLRLFSNHSKHIKNHVKNLKKDSRGHFIWKKK